MVKNSDNIWLLPNKEKLPLTFVLWPLCSTWSKFEKLFLNSFSTISGWQSFCLFSPFFTHWFLFLLQIPKSVHSPKIYSFFTLPSWKFNPHWQLSTYFKSWTYTSLALFIPLRAPQHTNFNFSLDIFTWNVPPTSQTLWCWKISNTQKQTILYWILMYLSTKFNSY